MDVALRRSGVPLYTIGHAYFRLFILSPGHFQKRTCEAKGQFWIFPRRFASQRKRWDTSEEEKRGRLSCTWRS